jgi:AAA ATPase domain
MAGPAGFVGRESELSRLLGALGGDARLVLIVGDAGVGKTRFVGEGIARATAMGMVMVRGECLPLSGTLPLLPVADALSEVGRLQGGALLAAALDVAPAYVRDEVGRLLPAISQSGRTAPDDREGEWSRERLFAGVAELLAAVSRRSRSGVGLVVEDVHWADSATLDCLTFVARAGRREGMRLVVTCRGDERLAEHVAAWLAQVRAGAGVEEIRLGPLSRSEVAGQVTGLTTGAVSPRVLDELYARAEGNPFFTEQLVAAAQAGEPQGGPRVPAELPVRLAELLTARAARCAGNGRAVLEALAVAGRPLTEALLGEVTGLDTDAVRQGLRELAAARLLAEDTPDGGHRPRHALLAAAVCHRAAVYRTSGPPTAGLPLMEEALRLFEQVPPSADHADALLDYAALFLLWVERRPQATAPALNRALEIADLAGATAMVPRILSVMGWVAFMRGQVEEGFATRRHQQSRLRLRVRPASRGGGAVGGAPRGRPGRDPAHAGPVSGSGPDHHVRAAAHGEHAGLCRSRRAGPGTP